MASILQKTFNKLTTWKPSADKVIEETDAIFREAINRHADENTGHDPRVVRENDQFTGQARSIVGQLKKRFTPNRGISNNGVFTNRFNFSDIYSAYVGENLFKFSVDKYTEASLRNGYFIKSKNPTVVKYLNMRHKQMEMVSGSPFKEYMTDYFTSLIMNGNVYSVKHRQTEASGGREYTNLAGKKIKPMASLYVEDPRKLIIGEGPGGRMRYVRIPSNVQDIKLNQINPSIFTMAKEDLDFDWDSAYAPSMVSPFARQFSRLFRLSPKRRRQYVVYDEHEMDHIRYHHVAGEKIAMPPFWGTLNDIDSLRRIEENIELLVFQYGHPILQGKVGEEGRPGTEDEINDIIAKIEQMESNGFIATTNRVVLEMIGAENTALRLEAYLQYFYRRVLTGLWLSEVTVGQGSTSNRSTANVLDKLSQEKVMELQRIFADHHQKAMFEMMIEAGAEMGWIIRPENIPTFEFNSIDLEGKIRQEQHSLTLYQGDLITRTEARGDMGREPMSKEEEKDTFVNHVSIPVKEAGQAMMNKAQQQQLTPRNQSGKNTGPSRSQNK